MPTRIVNVFLTPKDNNASEAELKAHPDNVTLFIDTDENNQLIEVDDVYWEYVTQPPPDANAQIFPEAPQPQDVYIEVRFAPSNTPFQPPTNNLMASLEGDSASYGNLGLNPLVPNLPRLDSAPEPPLEFVAGNENSGQPQPYKYAVVLTSQSDVYTLDPKLIIIRRRRRQGL